MKNNYYIFGAHPRGYTMYQYLRTLEPDRKNLGFLFDNDEKNSEEIEGIRVCFLDNTDSCDLDLNAVVYLATRGIHHDHARGVLLAVGFSADKIIAVTPQLDTELRNKYVRRVYESEGRSFEKIVPDGKGFEISAIDACRGKGCIYVAKTIFDKAFSTDVPLKEYESIIQAGTALADHHLDDAGFFDDSGDNISGRNKQFCELTALYWIWKNARREIIGLEHWRRRFILPDNWIDRIESEGIDVILPVPLCVMPSLEENYRSRHNENVWDHAMELINEIHPDESEAVRKFFKDRNLYSPCNMIIARRSILQDYCAWIFPVLLKLNDDIGTLEDSYQNRYPGFISERLLNYYFESRREHLHIVYADKNFLS